MAATDKVRNPERAQEIVTLRKEGLSYDKIAERVGVNPGTVSYYLKMAGMTGTTKKPRRKIEPIVYRAEQNGTGHALDDLFSGLSLESKIAALKAVIEGRK